MSQRIEKLAGSLSERSLKLKRFSHKVVTLCRSANELFLIKSTFAKLTGVYRTSINPTFNAIVELNPVQTMFLDIH